VAAASGPAKGIAPDAKLLSMKVLGHSGVGRFEALCHALKAAADAKCDLACMSLGAPKASAELHAAVRHATSNGVIVVCAAGNDGGAVDYPAAFTETIAVGAVDKSGKVCEFSSRGKEIVVAAPGQDITSTWLNEGYATISGTSMAAPFVVGVLALYISAAKRDGRKIDVMKALQETCRDVGTPGRDDTHGWVLVDPAKLVNFTTSQHPPAGVTIYIPGGRVL
jgi:subtilisin family serine protease